MWSVTRHIQWQLTNRQKYICRILLQKIQIGNRWIGKFRCRISHYIGYWRHCCPDKMLNAELSKSVVSDMPSEVDNVWFSNIEILFFLLCLFLKGWLNEKFCFLHQALAFNISWNLPKVERIKFGPIIELNLAFKKINLIYEVLNFNLEKGLVGSFTWSI